MNVKKFIIFTFVFILILSTSETIHSYHQKNPRFYHSISLYHLYLSKIDAHLNRTESTFYHFNEAVEIKLNQKSQNYPESLTIKHTLPSLDNFEIKLAGESNQLLLTIKPTQLIRKPLSAWSGYFYNLGVINYHPDQYDLTVSLWETAIKLAPYWSYYYVELANLYASNHQIKEANQVLNQCFNYRSASVHCRESEKNLFSPQPIGFLSETINQEPKLTFK